MADAPIKSNRFSYIPRGDSQKFASHFERLKARLLARFHAELAFNTNTVIWNDVKHCVTVTFPKNIDSVNQAAVDHFILGFFEGLGF